MRELMLDGRRFFEWEHGKPAAIGIRPGPTEFYRDGNGDIRRYASDGRGSCVDWHFLDDSEG